MIDSAQHKGKSFHKAASWKPKKEVHHGDRQTLEIQKNAKRDTMFIPKNDLTSTRVG